MFSGCSCVVGNMSWSKEGFALSGKCGNSCNHMPVLLFFLFIIIFFTFLCSIPALTATLRWEATVNLLKKVINSVKTGFFSPIAGVLHCVLEYSDFVVYCVLCWMLTHSVSETINRAGQLIGFQPQLRFGSSRSYNKITEITQFKNNLFIIICLLFVYRF